MRATEIETLRGLLDVASYLLDRLNTCRAYAGGPLVPEDSRVADARELICRMEDADTAQ